MSFNNFPYTYLASVLQQNIDKANVDIGVIDTKLACTSNLTGNITYLASIGNGQLQTMKNELIDKRYMYQEMLSEINGIIALPEENKTLLYNFYIESGDTLGVKRVEYVQRIMFNTSEMISHASNVMSEISGLADEDKTVVFDIVCNNCSIHSNTNVLFNDLVIHPL